MADKNKTNRQGKWVLIALGFLFIFILIWVIISNLDYGRHGQPVVFGVTFSKQYAQELGLDWSELYLAILDDLHVKNIRLAVNWNEVEPQDDFYNFADYEWMVEQAQKRGVNIIMAIGRRTPRWPECHAPKWAKALPLQKQNLKLLDYLRTIITHFKVYKNITVWQVENEPLLNIFGECPSSNFDFLKQEVILAKSLDKRPIMLTDTGELSNWQRAASLADIFGTTMYKVVWNKYIGVWRYPWPPAYYHFKAERIKKKYHLKKVIVAELQAEPWSPGRSIKTLSLWEQLSLFDFNDFENNLDYVYRAGFHEAYLWGVEWWYWLKITQHEGGFWNRAKLIWQAD